MKNEIESFINYCKFRNLSDNTIVNYRIDLEQFVSVTPHFPHITSSFEVTNWLAGFSSQATISRKLSSLKSFYRWAVDVARIVSDNLVLNIDSPKIPRREMDYVKKDEYLGVINSLEDRNYKYNSRDKMMFDIMFNCGLRISELVSLRIGDFNFDTNTFNVIGKGNKERVCYMNKTVVASVKNWLEDIEKYRLKSSKNTDYLLNTKVSDQMSVRAAQFIVEKFAKTHAHAFRHGFCTEMVNNNVNLAVVAKLAGHESFNTTRRYVHPSAETFGNAVASLEM